MGYFFMVVVRIVQPAKSIRIFMNDDHPFFSRYECVTGSPYHFHHKGLFSLLYATL